MQATRAARSRCRLETTGDGGRFAVAKPQLEGLPSHGPLDDCCSCRPQGSGVAVPGALERTVAGADGGGDPGQPGRLQEPVDDDSPRPASTAAAWSQWMGFQSRVAAV